MLRNFRRDAVIRWIAHDQALFDRAVECVVQHRVDAANRRVAQPRLLSFLCFS